MGENYTLSNNFRDENIEPPGYLLIYTLRKKVLFRILKVFLNIYFTFI